MCVTQQYFLLPLDPPACGDTRVQPKLANTQQAGLLYPTRVYLPALVLQDCRSSLLRITLSRDTFLYVSLPATPNPPPVRDTNEHMP